MAISDAFYGVNPLVFGRNQVTIGTQTYTEQGLQRYIEECGDFIEQKNVISRLHAFQKAKATVEVFNDDYVILKDNPSEDNKDVLYIGNALSVALECKEYGLAEKLAMNGEILQDGQSVEIYKNKGEVFRVNKVVTVSVMELLLQKGDLPEQLWYTLWESYSGLDYKWSRNRFVPDAELKTVYQWVENLNLLREKRPELWERVVTEDLKCELLWAVTSDKKVLSKHNLPKFCKVLTEAGLIPEHQQVFWKVLAFRYKNVPEQSRVLTHTECYLRLWKVLTGQPVVLDWDSLECYELGLPENLDMICENRFDANNTEFEWWLKHVDVITDSEKGNPEYVIAYGLRDEANLIVALKSNLLSPMLLPTAIDRARRSAKSMLPLLIMKQHGEFDYRWEEG